MRYFLALLILLLAHWHAHAQDFRHPLLDALVPQVQRAGVEASVRAIDSALLILAPDADLRCHYFLRRYRSEQLYYQGLFDASMVDAQKARRIADGLGDSLLLASSMNQVAVLLEEQDDDQGAIALLREALKYFPKDARAAYPVTRPHRIHANLGKCLHKTGDHVSARIHLLRSLDLTRAVGDARGEAVAQWELGKLYLDAGDPDSAVARFAETRRLAHGMGIADVELDAYAEGAMALLRVGRAHDARELITAGEALLGTSTHIAPRSVVAFKRRVVDVLIAAGRYPEALSVAREWSALDSTRRVSERAARADVLSETARFDRMLRAEQQRSALQHVEAGAELRARTLTMVGVVTGFLLLLGLVVFVVMRARQREVLAASRMEHAAQERELGELRVRQQVSEDLHDDLGAGLSALKLNSEIAADLAGNTDQRVHAEALAAIAGELMGNMRQVLWSVAHRQATAGELALRAVDAARALCADRGYALRPSIQGRMMGRTATDAMHHLVWLVLHQGLKVMTASSVGGAIELMIDLNDGFRTVLTCREGAAEERRSMLAATLSEIDTRVHDAGGWLRPATRGALSFTLHLPFNERTRVVDTPSISLLLGVILIATTASTRAAVNERMALERDSAHRSMLEHQRAGRYESAVADWVRWQRADSVLCVAEDAAALTATRSLIDREQELEQEEEQVGRRATELRIARSQRVLLLLVSGIITLSMVVYTLLFTGRHRARSRIRALELVRVQREGLLADLRVRQRVGEEMRVVIGQGLEAFQLRCDRILDALEGGPERERIALVHGLAKELTSGLRQIIWALDEGEDELARTLGFVATYARTYAAQHGLAAYVELPTAIPLVRLRSDQRRNLFLVVKEALHNTVKHAEADRVSIAFRADHTLHAVITDNGRGLPAMITADGNGLRNMRKRITAIGGELEMTSDQGTRILISFPINRAEL